MTISLTIAGTFLVKKLKTFVETLVDDHLNNRTGVSNDPGFSSYVRVTNTDYSPLPMLGNTNLSILRQRRQHTLYESYNYDALCDAGHSIQVVDDAKIRTASIERMLNEEIPVYDEISSSEGEYQPIDKVLVTPTSKAAPAISAENLSEIAESLIGVQHDDSSEAEQCYESSTLVEDRDDEKQREIDDFEMI